MLFNDCFPVKHTTRNWEGFFMGSEQVLSVANGEVLGSSPKQIIGILRASLPNYIPQCETFASVFWRFFSRVLHVARVFNLLYIGVVKMNQQVIFGLPHYGGDASIRNSTLENVSKVYKRNF
jgi:hypothetical protein